MGMSEITEVMEYHKAELKKRDDIIAELEKALHRDRELQAKTTTEIQTLDEMIEELEDALIEIGSLSETNCLISRNAIGRLEDKRKALAMIEGKDD